MFHSQPVSLLDTLIHRKKIGATTIVAVEQIKKKGADIRTEPPKIVLDALDLLSSDSKQTVFESLGRRDVEDGKFEI